jgi:hypothetical protein
MSGHFLSISNVFVTTVHHDKGWINAVKRDRRRDYESEKLGKRISGQVWMRHLERGGGEEEEEEEEEGFPIMYAAALLLQLHIKPAGKR